MVRLDTQTEQNLVQAARAGCVESFGRLYEHYYGPMVWLAYSILTDRDLAEDAAQEAFAKACAGLAGLRRPERFGAWLACICRNEARQVLRSKKQAASDPEVQEPEAGPAGPDGHDEAVQRAVEQLPEMYRDVVVLHYYGDLSYEQIHQTLGISIDQIKGRLNRARRQIAEELEKRNLELRTQNAEHRMGRHFHETAGR